MWCLGRDKPYNLFVLCRKKIQNMRNVDNLLVTTSGNYHTHIFIPLPSQNIKFHFIIRIRHIIVQMRKSSEKFEPANTYLKDNFVLRATREYFQLTYVTNFSGESGEWRRVYRKLLMQFSLKFVLERNFTRWSILWSF